MHYVLDFRGGPLNGQIMKLPHRPSSVTFAFDEGPTAIYVQGRLNKRVEDGFIQEMVEADYDQVTPTLGETDGADSGAPGRNASEDI